MAQATRTFRIFVSSTFSDLKEERNALQKHVFPKLRELCQQRGCRFQAIDLRWGVREEAALDQQTMPICLGEIERCQKTTPRPNFIVLLGDRYGWRPLPTEIPANEFQEIERHVPDASDKELLMHWYRRDDNALPPVYCFQPRTGEFTNSDKWDAVEPRLRSVLLEATAEMTLTDDERLKYTASATEQEIVHGALRVPNAQEHVFGFFRTIKGLPQNETAKDYVDLDSSGKLDEDAHTRQNAIKQTLRQLLPGNVHDYEAQWTGSGITADHIPKLCEEVLKSLSRIIEEEIAGLEEVGALDKEIADHEAFGKERVQFFVGRADILRTIGDYVQEGDRHLLAVVGEPGSGKSALMARAAEQARSDHAGAVVVVRFIGATPGSSDGRALLDSLCRQISRAYGADEATVPTDYKELVDEFPKRLALATDQRMLILFLDALDQLSDAEHARNLIWLPGELPEQVRLIVSTLPGECEAALKRKLPASNLAKLEPMPGNEGRELLDLWLTDAGRTLQPHQRGEVLSKFAACGLPLYLKLAFEDTRRWKSYSPMVSLSPDTPGIIGQLFARLSLHMNHGAIIVSHSLSYLAAAKNGLTEDELLDVLSRDQDVLDDFKARAKHTPPEERLPVIVWSRLYFDLEPYLTERSADRASLMGFYHRQLREVVDETFLAGDEKRKRHASLAAYFASRDLFEKEEKTPNIRKLSELPYQQTHGQMWDELYGTLTDFEFLEAKCTHVAVVTSGRGENARTVYGGVYELQEDYRLALEHFPAG